MLAHSAYLLWGNHTATSISGWFTLAALTLLSGSATVRLPSVPGDHFHFRDLRLHLCNPVWVSCWRADRRARRSNHFLLVGAASARTSPHPFQRWARPVHLAGLTLYFAFPHIHALAGHDALELKELIVPIGAFALSHFLLNSWFIAGAVAFETRRSPQFHISEKSAFLWLSLNYFGGASIAALLAIYRAGHDFSYLGAIVPLLLILYFTFKVPMARVEDANRHLGTLKPSVPFNDRNASDGDRCEGSSHTRSHSPGSKLRCWTRRGSRYTLTMDYCVR